MISSGLVMAVGEEGPPLEFAEDDDMLYAAITKQECSLLNGELSNQVKVIALYKSMIKVIRKTYCSFSTIFKCTQYMVYHSDSPMCFRNLKLKVLQDISTVIL